MPKDKKPRSRSMIADARRGRAMIADATAELRDKATACESMIESIAAVLGVDLVGELGTQTMPHNLALIMARLPRAPESQALLAALPGETVRADLRTALDTAARELGLASGKDESDVLVADAITAEIIRIKGSQMQADTGDGAAVETGDTLAMAVDHQRQALRKAEGDLFAARLLINRIAAIVGVDKWDEEGAPLLDILNRWKGGTQFATGSGGHGGGPAGVGGGGGGGGRGA